MFMLMYVHTLQDEQEHLKVDGYLNTLISRDELFPSITISQLYTIRQIVLMQFPDKIVGTNIDSTVNGNISLDNVIDEVYNNQSDLLLGVCN